MTSNDALPDDAVANTKPLDVDGVNAAIAGTVVFAIAFVVLLVLSLLLTMDNSWMNVLQQVRKLYVITQG